MEARARLRFLKSSAQKVRLVADLVRGLGADEALRILRTTPKAVAKDLEILLRSAIANAEQKNPQVDVDDLYVARIWVDAGPSEKRVQPAPMGRAYRIIKRRSHVTIAVAERPGAKTKDKEAKAAEKKSEPTKPAAKGAAAAKRTKPAKRSSV